MTEETWLLLDRYGIVLGDSMLTLSVLAAIIGFFRRNDLKRWLRRNSFGRIGTPTPPDLELDALLLPVSKADIPNWIIDTQRPRYLALIATPQSLDAARQIEEHAYRQGAVSVTIATLMDTDDAKACRDLATSLLRQLQDAGAQRLGADTTGGKVPMSLGVFMAAEEAGVATLYVSADYDDALKRPKLDTARLILISTPVA